MPSDVFAGLRLVHEWQKSKGVLDTDSMLKNTTRLSASLCRCCHLHLIYIAYSQERHQAVRCHGIPVSLCSRCIWLAHAASHPSLHGPVPLAWFAQLHVPNTHAYIEIRSVWQGLFCGARRRGCR